MGGEKDDDAVLCFAYWSPDGYYYPAIISEADDDRALVHFHDDEVKRLAWEDILSLPQAEKALSFEGNWKNKGCYYTCNIIKVNPLTVKYHEDGVIEQIEITQLRGNVGGRAKRKVEPESGGIKRFIKKFADDFLDYYQRREYVDDDE